MKNLNLFAIDTIDQLVNPEDFKEITLQSPATAIFTDFKLFKPLIIDENTKAIDAMKLMRKAHVRMKIVMSDKKEFIGIISSSDICEQRIINEVTKGHGRDEILVTDLMQPKADLNFFDFNELKQATVNDVIEALKLNGLKHCLVVDRDKHHIRGLISSSDIARKLHISIEIGNVSFAQLFNAISL